MTKMKPQYLRIILFAALIIFLPGCESVSKSGNIVKVIKTAQGHELLVHGEPFYIKGVGVGEAYGKKGENYLKMAKALGANTVRTWGTDQGTKKYLDEAARQGLLVDAGIWLNYVAPDGSYSYIRDTQYMADKEKETLDYVKRFKDHPAILMWNVGNEAFMFTKGEDERIALANFLEKLIKKVKAEDPNHPVIYASANTTALPYLNKYVPSLDIVGMNIYGSVVSAESRWKTLGYKIPYVVTEFGPLGPWDLPKDRNGRMIELSDYTKASQYRNHWRLITERRGKNLGGFVFHLGETTQETLTAWNINDHLYKKESFLEMQKLFIGKNIKNHSPRVDSISGIPDQAAPGAIFSVEVKASDPEKDKLSYIYIASSSAEGILAYYVNNEVLLRVEGRGPAVKIYAPSQKGLYRIYAFVRDSAGNSSVKSRTVKVE